MLLAIDIGNSNVTLGVFQGQRLRMRAKASVQTRPSAEMLKETTALLPAIELAGAEEACLGRNSADAIRRGLLWGSAMMIDGFIGRFTALPGMAGAVCVATGGSGELVTALCSREVIRDPDLTLKGLRCLYEANLPRQKAR